MARLCERPGCSQPAEVIFGIDPERLVVWLEGLDGNVVQRAGVLCRRHADSMVVPVGWMLDDRRTEAPRLFTPRVPTPVRHRPPRRQRSGGAVDDEPRQEASQLALDMSADDRPPAAPPPADAADRMGSDALPLVASDDAAPEVADPPTRAWAPKFDQSDDLGGLLTARSPLLSRAFRLDATDEPAALEPALDEAPADDVDGGGPDGGH